MLHLQHVLIRRWRTRKRLSCLWKKQENGKVFSLPARKRGRLTGANATDRKSLISGQRSAIGPSSERSTSCHPTKPQAQRNTCSMCNSKYLLLRPLVVVIMVINGCFTSYLFLFCWSLFCTLSLSWTFMILILEIHVGHGVALGRCFGNFAVQYTFFLFSWGTVLNDTDGACVALLSSVVIKDLLEIRLYICWFF